jgi:hypothetical protein
MFADHVKKELLQTCAQHDTISLTGLKSKKRNVSLPAIRIELMTLSLLVIRSTTEPSGL